MFRLCCPLPMAGAERAAARPAVFPQHCSGAGSRSSVTEVRMSQTRSSYEPTRLAAGQAAMTAPAGPCAQPWAMFAVRVAAMPIPSRQRARGYCYPVPGRVQDGHAGGVHEAVDHRMQPAIKAPAEPQ